MRQPYSPADLSVNRAGPPAGSCRSASLDLPGMFFVRARILSGSLERALGICTTVTETLPEKPVAFYNLAAIRVGESKQVF